MEWKSIVRDKTTEDVTKLSLSRSTAVIVTVVLSAGFMMNAWRKAVSWEVYVAYPLGVALAFAPQLFLRLLVNLKEVISAWKGGTGGADI